jgi:broad specificity phosphatase PhoE
MSLSSYADALKLPRSLIKKIPHIASAAIFFNTIQPAFAGMLTFPLPAPLKNNIVLVRSGECFADSKHEVETNPVKKLRLDNALTFKGRQEAIDAAKRLNELDFMPTYIWTSNTERAYETAAIIARETQLGQNRIVPEYSFLDARAMGIYEGKNSEESVDEIHRKDEEVGVKYKPPPNNDGTPSKYYNWR